MERMALLQHLARSGVAISQLDLDSLVAQDDDAVRSTVDSLTHNDDDLQDDELDSAHSDDDIGGMLARVVGGSRANSASNALYDALVSSVERQIRQLKVVLESAEAKEKEREFVAKFLISPH